MDNPEHSDDKETSPRSFLHKNKLPIGIVLLAFFMLAPIVTVYMSARTLELEGTIVRVDNDGTIWVRAELDGINIGENAVGWGIGLTIRYLSIDGYVRENKTLVVSWK